MEGGARNGRRAIMVKEARIWLECRKMSSIDVECLDFMPVRPTCDLMLAYNEGIMGKSLVSNNLHSKNGCVFVDAQCSQCVTRGVDGGDGVVHSKIPQPDFSVSAPGN